MYAWIIRNGPLPEGRQIVCHTCDRPLCVEALHLYAGTHQMNVDDMMARGRAGWQQNPGQWVELGRRVGRARRTLPVEMIEEVRASSDPVSVLATRYGVGKGAIQSARLGVRLVLTGTCLLCHAGFETNQRGQKYCSPRCSSAAYGRRVGAKRRQGRPPAPTHCQSCGTPIPERPGFRNFCSPGCKSSGRPLGRKDLVPRRKRVAMELST